MRCSLFVVRCSLLCCLFVGWVLFVVCCLLVHDCRLFVCSSVVVCYVLFVVVRCLWFGVVCWWCVVCCLFFVVWSSMFDVCCVFAVCLRFVCMFVV